MKKIITILFVAAFLIGCSTNPKQPKPKWPKLDTSSSLAGPDVDNNGIRDDIDAYIKTLDVNDYERRSIEFISKDVQKIITIDINNSEELKKLMSSYNKSLSCFMINVYKTENFSLEDKFNPSQMIANTKKRWIAYRAFDDRLSGTVFSSKSNLQFCKQNGFVQ